MPADAALVEDLAGYVEGTDFTSAQFVRYLGWAEDQVATDAPNISGSALDQALGLLVAHYIARKATNGGEYQTEKSGDWSGTRATAAGETAWLVAYRALLEKNGTVQPSAGIVRADRIASRAFALSDQRLPEVP